MPVVRGDGLRLRQVLTNLLGNAIKFTEVGTVSLRVHCAWRSGSRQLLRFDIRDSGIGVPRAEKQRIFQAFSQADSSMTRRYGGTGLGLAISKQLIERMGGTIDVDSEPGRGSTFWFTLPLETAGERAAGETSPPPGLPAALPPAKFTGRLLLVEDNPVNQEVAQVMLQDLGCEVVTAPNGWLALAAWEAQDFDLVLMDCQMPEMDGYQTAREMRRRELQERDAGAFPQADSDANWRRPAASGRARSRTPIVALTAGAMAGDRQRCLEAGMDDYIAKPCSRLQLRSVLQRWLPRAAEGTPPAGETLAAGAGPPSAAVDLTLPRGALPASQPAAFLDPEALAGLRMLERQKSQRVLPRLIEIYLNTSSQHLLALRQAILQNDAAGMERTAHTFKSGNANLGATRLAELCRELETMGRANSTSGAAHLLAIMETEYERVREALTAELGKYR
jgi:CheY-like chemotaxis protein/HPt (histidine-containing phosphotransfer) domain-containing protein